MPLERLLSHIAYSSLVASRHGSNSERGDSNRRYRMSVGRNSAHSTQRPNPVWRARPSIYTAPPAIQPAAPSLPPRSSAVNSPSLACNAPQITHTPPNPIPQPALSSPPPPHRLCLRLSSTGFVRAIRQPANSAHEHYLSPAKRNQREQASWGCRSHRLARWPMWGSRLIVAESQTAQHQPMRSSHCRR